MKLPMTYITRPLRTIVLGLVITAFILVVSILTSMGTLTYIKLDSQGALPRSLSLGVQNILKQKNVPQQQTPSGQDWNNLSNNRLRNV